MLFRYVVLVNPWRCRRSNRQSASWELQLALSPSGLLDVQWLEPKSTREDREIRNGETSQNDGYDVDADQ
jgi:hypothetical protein